MDHTGTAMARAEESSDTMKTVMLRATKESQKESGFFDFSVAASPFDMIGTSPSWVCSGLTGHVIWVAEIGSRE